MKQEVLHGDCIEQLKEIESNTVDSILTDPPYELGFMGKSWDKTGIANNVDMWKECLRVLKPGGHLLAFSGTRTYHRMASAIEDAGFEVRDMIEWVYGSGFPKSLNIGKAVDKLQGNKREVIGKIAQPGSTNSRIAMGNGWQEEPDLTKGTSEWEGWGTALKPAHEPICMARKPLECKTVAENCLKYGTGGINIDESRIGTDTITVNRHSGYNSNSLVESTKGKWKGEQEQVTGRFPANLIHDNSEEVRECFPESTSVRSKRGGVVDSGDTYSLNWKEKETYECGFNDSGNASRFFKSIIYQAKASKSDRGDSNKHPTVKPVALMEYLIKMVTPKNGVVLDPFAGSGSTGVACKQLGVGYILIEKEAEYIEIINKRLENLTTQH